jgi:hypothetical protein
LLAAALFEVLLVLPLTIGRSRRTVWPICTAYFLGSLSRSKAGAAQMQVIKTVAVTHERRQFPGGV